MKKLKDFFVNLFTKNIAIKLLSIALAAIAVILINVN